MSEIISSDLDESHFGAKKWKKVSAVRKVGIPDVIAKGFLQVTELYIFYFNIFIFGAAIIYQIKQDIVDVLAPNWVVSSWIVEWMHQLWCNNCHRYRAGL